VFKTDLLQLDGCLSMKWLRLIAGGAMRRVDGLAEPQRRRAFPSDSRRSCGISLGGRSALSYYVDLLCCGSLGLRRRGSGKTLTLQSHFHVFGSGHIPSSVRIVSGS